MRILDIPRYQATGILECLFHFAQGYAQRGDVGKWTDEQIAAAIGWPAADAGRLVLALTNARWLEPHGEHRLIIHDWEVHADQTVRRNQTVLLLGFVRSDYGPGGKSPILADASRVSGERTEVQQSVGDVKSCRMLANESQKSEVDSQPMPMPVPAPMPAPMPKPPTLSARLPFQSEDFEDAWTRWTTHRKEIGHMLKPTTRKAQLKKLEKMGHERAIATIEHSIEQGYTGLYEPTAGSSPGQPQRSVARIQAPPGKYNNFEYANRPKDANDAGK